MIKYTAFTFNIYSFFCILLPRFFSAYIENFLLTPLHIKVGLSIASTLNNPLTTSHNQFAKDRRF
jgi:hypothetical protein